MKVAIYSCVSTSKQDNGNQLVQLREFAAKQKWEVVIEYVDTVSGSGKKDRLQFERMMLAASQKQFDILLFWKLDRFTREAPARPWRTSRAWTHGEWHGALTVHHSSIAAES